MNKNNPLKIIIIVNNLITNLLSLFQNEKDPKDKEIYFQEITRLIKEQKDDLNEIKKLHCDCLPEQKNNQKWIKLYQHNILFFKKEKNEK